MCFVFIQIFALSFVKFIKLISLSTALNFLSTTLNFFVYKINFFAYKVKFFAYKVKFFHYEYNFFYIKSVYFLVYKFLQLLLYKKELYNTTKKELNNFCFYNQFKMIGQDNRFKKILNLLPQTNKIRNVSIVAHVDHGKTTIADCLISSNGIIHKKQAGQLRLLDDRFDEQDRGITMKSSSISLIYQDCLINLIDSPGHLQFYSEVSSALRLTDAALLVVDVVQGVSSQTYRVLRQLYQQKLPSILVLNKIDKLILHCKMDPMQAFTHINQIIEQVNAILGSFISNQLTTQNCVGTASEDTQKTKQFQNLQNKFYFSTQKRNIIFSSALDNWGFTVECFSPLIAKKLNKKPQQINKYLWGQYYFNPKTKQFSQKPRNQNDRPVCVDWVLKPVWDIFQNVQSENKQKIEKVVTTLGLKISENTKKNYNNQLIKQILNAWLPFDIIALKRIIQILPSPPTAQNFRLPYLLNLESQQVQVKQQIKKALSTCSFENQEPLIIFISKMVNVPNKNVNERGLQELKSQDNFNKTLGFGRIFSGRLKRGDSVFVIGAKKKKITNQMGQTIQIPDIQKVRIDNLYIFNGQYPDGIQQAYAGNIIGIGNLDDSIFKSGTVSSTQDCISFIPVNLHSKSVLKVSVSTPNIEDNNKLLQGLKKLNKSDPSVEVYIQTTGDLILNTSGQVHLEKCVVDLQKIYCKIPIKISDPIISFRQTIIWTKLDENKNQKYILEANKKQRQKQKKQLMQKFKQERVNDTELDQLEKQKLKAIKEWDSHVEIYQSQDLTVQDTRFFFKNRDDLEEQKQKYSYKQQKQLKKVDHKNRGKQHIKQKFLNLGLKTNVTKQLTPNQLIWIKVKAIGINFQMVQYLEKQQERMKKIFGAHEKQNGVYKHKYDEERIKFINEFFDKCKQFDVDENVRNLLRQKMVCFGPNQYGSNLLVFRNMDQDYSLSHRIMNPEEDFNNKSCLRISQDIQKILDDYKVTLSEFENSIKLGFDLACTSGPLCNQPLIGVIFILEDIVKAQVVLSQKAQTLALENAAQQKRLQGEQKQKKQQSPKKNQIKQKQTSQTKNLLDSFGPLTGQLMSTMKDTCIESFIGGSPRLVQPLYYCQLQTDQQYYGNVYNELSKRRATIISDELHEISNVFVIKAYIPVVQSQKFCFNLQDTSKGTVNAQLRLDTWKIYNQDPFFVPLTEQEIEENGLQNVIYNPARILLQKIRAKKGMPTTEKIVIAAQKQRNLKSK